MNKPAGYTRFTNRDTSITGLGKANLAEVEMKKMSQYQSSDLQPALEIKLPKFFLKVVILWFLLIITGESALAQTELITNGGFETVGSGWVVLTNGVNQTDSWWNINNPTGAHSGSRYEYIGAQQDGISPANNVDGVIYQTVTIPAGTTSATLSYYLRITTSESSSAAFDHLYVEIRNTSGAVLATPVSYSNQNASQFSSWTQQTVNLSSYAGQTIRVAFHGVTDSTIITVFRIDDVSLQATGTTVPAAPTLNSPGSTSSPGPVITTLTPLMSWNAVNGATNYGLYVYDVTTSTLIYNNDFVGNGTSLTLPSLTAGHSYRWNMRASNSAGFSGYSGLLYFQTQATTPTAPAPSSPSGGQVITTLTPQLTWSGGSNFSSLQINISKSPFGVANIIYTSSWLSAGTTSVTVPSGTLVAGTDYRWDVTACSGANGTGTCVTGSNATFSTQAANGGGFYLSFPLVGQTHLSASINSVFDHSMSSPYTKDDIVVAYNGERGEKRFGWDGDTSHPGFKNSVGTAFVINGNYTGAGAPTYLNYDGHPGIDYRAASGTPVYATADGVVHYPSSIPGLSNASLYHTMAIDHGNGYVTYFLHCLTHPSVGNAVIPEGTAIHRGDLAAYSGEAGVPGAPHLHVEVHYQGIPVDPYGWEGSGSDPYTAAASVNLWNSGSTSRALGIDVNHVGSVDWSQVHSAGETFAIIKATDGLRAIDAAPGHCVLQSNPNSMCENPDFSNYITAAKQAGVLVGAYHFARPYLNSAKNEADFFLSVARNYIGAGYLPPALDIEDPYDDPPGTQVSSMTKAALSQWIREWCAEIQLVTGIKPMLYMTPWFTRNLIESDIAQYPLWIAYYENTPDINPTNFFGPWNNSWTFLQYSVTGHSVNGVQDSPVDLDVFNGDITALNNYIGGGIASDTTPPTISALNVSSSTVTLGQGFTIGYTVSDSGGSHLKQVELWRASIDGTINDSSWTRIGNPIPLSGDGPSNGSFPIDIPSALGNYWYGIHVLDNANPANYMDERIAGLGPVHVTVTPPSDTIPDAFSFTPQTGVALNTTVTSNTITVSGINAAAAISITGGSYSVNGGAFVTGSGTVNNSNTVAVRLTSSGSFSTQTCATLTIGGVPGSFCTTTQAAPVDTIPDAFSFTPQTGVALNTTDTSNTITVSGINAVTSISVTGGSYSVSGGAFTTVSGTVNNSNAVAVRLTSSGSYSTQTCATLNIGGVQGSFCATTQSQPVDTTPDPFSFTPQTGVALNTTVTSNTITVSGINAAASISITGGSYSSNGGAFTTVSGTVNNGNTVAVRLTSSGSYSTQTCATLTIGGVPGSFCVTTQAAPVATIVFVELAGICNGNTPCFSSIQQAIDAVALGGTVRVAQDAYHENLVVNSSRSFTLEGGWNTSFTLRSLNPALTVIDGDTNGDGVGDGRVFESTALSGVDITLEIDGFTIQNGTGRDGGGVFGWASSGGSLELNLTRNIIKNNQTTNSGAGVGVYAQDSGTTAHATLTNNMIFGNDSGGNGGGVYAYADLSGELTMTLTNNTITDNTAVGVGGGLRAYASHGSVNDVTVKNSIIWGNTAASGQDIAVRQSVAGIATVNSSFNDVGDALPDATGPGTYNNLGNNINTDPLFVNLIGGDLRLGAGSPAIDAGTSTDAPVTDFEGQARPQGAGYDMGADESIPVPPLSVLTPKSGDIWRIGTNQTINWMPSGVTGNVQIQISRNGGSWKAIINNTANDGSQAWKVAKPATLRAKVRVCRISAPLICGPSSPTFIIQ